MNVMATGRSPSYRQEVQLGCVFGDDDDYGCDFDAPSSY